MNKILGHLLSVLLGALLSGCGGKAGDQPASFDNTEAVETYYREHPERFVFATPAQLPQHLDWQDGSGMPTFGDPNAKRGGELTLRLSSMQQTLRVVGPDANTTLRGPLWSANSVNLLGRHPWMDGYIPGLAREWAIDPVDSRTIYLKLDPDARWSDGKPFSAEDVFFSLYFLLSPDINDPAINRVYDENIQRITRYDAETIAITQTKPSPDPLFGMTSLILVQRDFYREFGSDYTDRYHWRFSPVTGPYTVNPDEVKRGRQITFERLPHWWADDKPFYRHRFNPDKLTYVVIRDDAKAFEFFLNGQLDWFPLDLTELWYDRADDSPFRKGYIERAQVYDQLPAARVGLYMNAMQPMLSDRTLRIGIQYAINFDKVNEGLYRGDRRRIRAFADGYGAYSHPTLRARPFDLEKAKQYFAEAGFVNRGADGILVNDKGQRLSFALTVTNTGDQVQLASILKEEAKKAGLELIIDSLDTTASFTKIFKKDY
ncbi:MAG: hypothetical protein KDI19_14590, partial [Pseudomonadales bacterium]|nr:hypothetical protein [Pseudomonadales bacterium]